MSHLKPNLKTSFDYTICKVFRVKKIINLSALLCGLILFSTNPHVLSQEVQKIRINPDQSYGGGVSEYFDQVEYIPLETTRQSLFGDIDHFVITDSSFIIYDRDTKDILFFKLNGKFITRIKLYQDAIPSVSFDKYQKKIVVSFYNRVTTSYSRRYFTQYGKEAGQSKTIIKLDNAPSIYPLEEDVFVLGGRCYYDNNKSGQEDSIIHLLHVYKNDSLYKSFFPIIPKNNPGFCAILHGYPNLTSIPGTNAAYTSIPGEYDIYKITADSVHKLYQLVFPAERTFPPLTGLNQKQLEDSISKIRRNMKIIRGVNNIFITKDLLLFKIVTQGFVAYPGSEAIYQYNFIYKLKTQKLSSVERITPDSGSYFLPIIGSPWFSQTGLKSDGRHFYTHLSSLQMFTARDAAQSREVQYPSALKEYFSTQNRKSNPVIVRMKLKE